MNGVGNKLVFFSLWGHHWEVVHFIHWDMNRYVWNSLHNCANTWHVRDTAQDLNMCTMEGKHNPVQDTSPDMQTTVWLPPALPPKAKITSTTIFNDWSMLWLLEYSFDTLNKQQKYFELNQIITCRLVNVTVLTAFHQGCKKKYWADQVFWQRSFLQAAINKK